MSMRRAIENFPSQFGFEPKVEHENKLARLDGYIVVGMGGSHLAARIIKELDPSLDIFIHRNYGLPKLGKKELKSRLVILSSYSGNTEEVLDAYEKAGELGLPRAAISIGGQLLERAEKDGIPYVKMPDTGIQARSALGFSFVGLLKILGEETALKEAQKLRNTLRPEEYEEEGKKLAEHLFGHIPIIYASLDHEAIAYNWKIACNETGKIPAFYNVFPELNHNEMAGFDAQDTSRKLSRIFSFIFLKDQNDHPRIQKRMAMLEQLYCDRNMPVKAYELHGENHSHKIFSSLVLADWTAYYTAAMYGHEPEAVPVVEEFKKLIA